MSTRTRISLDGAWDFQIDPDQGADVSAIHEWRTAQVPLPWQAQFDDLRQVSGTAWYRRHFDHAPAAPGCALILHFGAVDYYATVWLNGRKLGDHEGGYLPFEFDVTNDVAAGDNELVVRVVDPSDDRSRYAEMPFSEIPHGKQSWYGPIGGIWQSVWLEDRPAVHIRSLRLAPQVADAAIDIAVRFSGQQSPDREGEGGPVAYASGSAGRASLTARVFGPDGQQVAETMLDAGGQGRAALGAAPSLWSPDSPALYRVEVTLSGGDGGEDLLADYCGFRTVEARDGRIYLNGEPIYLRGALDQSYFPETIYTVPSVEYLEDQARKSKALGLNCLRIHIKIEDPRYYEVADRLGLLVWTEIPNWVLLTPATDRRAQATFRGMIERDGNHPSIIAWTLINENWGTDLTRNPDHRRWLIDFYHAAKQMDPTRLIVDNSACKTNAHVAGDLEDYHPYKCIPDHADEWDEWVDEFADRSSDWIWYPDCLDQRRPDSPLIVSEFGNWGLPDPRTLNEHGAEPWWFQTGHEWGDGIVHPHAMRHRFDFFGLGDVFGSFDEFILASQEHMARSLHYEISSMRLRPEIGGYVITELTDVHWECNGLMTMQRAVKHGLDPILTSVNQDNVVIIRPQQWSGQPGERIRVQVRAFGVDGPGQEGVIDWCAGAEQGSLPAPGGVVEVTLAQAGLIPIEATWRSGDAAVAVNRVEVACVQPAVITAPLRVLDNRGLAIALRHLGYDVTHGAPGKTPTDGEILVATRYGRQMQAAIQQGARGLLIADENFALSKDNLRLPAGAIVAREDTQWEGDWATSFSWLRKRGPFAGLPGGPLLEMEYADIMPDAVHAGLPAWAARSHSWSGLALGWIHKPVSLLSVLPYGHGRIAITTFKLNAGALGNNAIAQALLGGILEVLAE